MRDYISEITSYLRSDSSSTFIPVSGLCHIEASLRTPIILEFFINIKGRWYVPYLNDNTINLLLPRHPYMGVLFT